MFTKRRKNTVGYFELQRKGQAFGFVFGTIIGLAATYFVEWLPKVTEHFSTWLVTVAVFGSLGSVIASYAVDYLVDEDEQVIPPVAAPSPSDPSS